jgi:aryl-alcohol dehydrogenase-like predicted oxidoreductase
MSSPPPSGRVSAALAARRPVGGSAGSADLGRSAASGDSGGSALAIPRIALGCGNFGGVGSAPEFFDHGLTTDQALELMDAAWEFGIRHFDTADAYGGGRSERAIGQWIRSRGVRPLLTTKTFNPMTSGADHGLAPERIARQLTDSLGRLGIDQVDLYLAHDFDPDVPLADTLAAFEAARADGKIRGYGVSNFNAGQLADALAIASPQAIQNSYSLLTRQDERELLPLCARRDVAYLAFSPLAGGWLTGKYRRGERFPPGSRMTQRPGPYQGFLDNKTFDALDHLGQLADHRGTSMAGLALSWLLADDRVTQIVTGPGRPEHLKPIVDALECPLTDDEKTAIERVMT